MLQVMKVVNFGIVAVLLFFHGCSIYILASTKELRKNRFIVLVLYLSLSDIALGLEFIYHNVLRLMDLQGATFQYQCMVILHLACGTFIWSLIQTLLICLERLNATFTIKKGLLVHLTSNKCVVFCFTLCHSIAVLRIGIDMIDGPVPCDPKNSTIPLILFTQDIPCVGVVVSIISCYGVVVYRMTHPHKSVQTSGVTTSQSAKKMADKIRMRKSIITLGLIIALVVVVLLLRGIALFIFYMGNESKINDTLFMIINNVFIMLNPLLDPVIYILRIKTYRDHLRCKCIKRNSVSDVSNLATHS
ncbi:unnamed protein product [Mytilus edulis]|uniref:G-protein coupled receptors family 1 profile domain-containing protein n=1 Tax=Mytilus edulis TaxID=6550 RepID=A0A8S3PUX5_MYTED|nr:unnamed protein product [Mytilus edulis]